MDLNKFSNRQLMVNQLSKDIKATIDVLEETLKIVYDETALEDTLDDWSSLQRIQEQVWSLGDLLDAERLFLLSVLQLEDEKSKFIVQKNLNEFIKHMLYRNMDALLERAKTWEFLDYRVKKFQQDLARNIKTLRDWYQNEYLSVSGK